MARRSRTSRRSPDVGDAVQCTFGSDMWYDAIIVGKRRDGTLVCHSASAEADGEGHEGDGDSAEYGCWYLYDYDEGDEWRVAVKGLVPTQNPATNMLRKK